MDVIVIFHFGLLFALPPPRTAQKIKIKKKKCKKMPGDIIILEMCTKNYDEVMYGSSDMVCNRLTHGWTDRKCDI